MALLSPERPGCAQLLQALYALLMVLPQGTAYATLKDRLGAVSSLHIAAALGSGGAAAAAAVAALTGGGGGGSAVAGGARAAAAPAFDVAAAEGVFAASQRAARACLSTEIRSRSLLYAGGAGVELPLQLLEPPGGAGTGGVAAPEGAGSSAATGGSAGGGGAGDSAPPLASAAAAALALMADHAPADGDGAPEGHGAPEYFEQRRGSVSD